MNCAQKSTHSSPLIINTKTQIELRCVHLLLQIATFAHIDFQSNSLCQMTTSLSPAPKMMLYIVLYQLRIRLLPHFLSSHTNSLPVSAMPKTTPKNYHLRLKMYKRCKNL